MTTTKHEDQRGFFQELYHFNHDDNYAQVSWFSISPGQCRGGHFHHRTSELFIVLDGEVDAVVVEQYEVASITRLKQGETFRTIPKQKHAFYSEVGAKILAFSSRHYNANDPDTFPSKDLLDLVNGWSKK